eukprot:jgi/Chlat1/1733/Chrsp13S02156
MAPAGPGHGGAAAGRVFAAAGQRAQRSKRLRRKEKRRKAIALAAEQHEHAASGGTQWQEVEAQERAEHHNANTLNKQRFKKTRRLSKKQNRAEAAPIRLVRTSRLKTTNGLRAAQDRLPKKTLKRKKPRTQSGGSHPSPAELQAGTTDAHAKHTCAKDNTKSWCRKRKTRDTRVTALQLPTVQDLERQLRLTRAMAEESIAKEQLEAAALAYANAKKHRMQLAREMQGVTQQSPTQEAEMRVAKPESRPEQATCIAAGAEAHDPPQIARNTPVTSARHVPATPPLAVKATASQHRNSASSKATGVKGASYMRALGENSNKQVEATLPPADGAERPIEVASPSKLVQQGKRPQQSGCTPEDRDVVEDAQGESPDVVNQQIKHLTQPQQGQHADEQHVLRSQAGQAAASPVQVPSASPDAEAECVGRIVQAAVDAVSEVGNSNQRPAVQDKHPVVHDGRALFGNLPRPVVTMAADAAVRRMQAANERATRDAYVNGNQHIVGKRDIRTAEVAIALTLRTAPNKPAQKAAAVHGHSQYVQRLKDATARYLNNAGGGHLRPNDSSRAPIFVQGQPSKVCANEQHCDVGNERPAISPQAECSKHSRTELLPTASPQPSGNGPQSLKTQMLMHAMPVEVAAWVGSADVGEADAQQTSTTAVADLEQRVHPALDPHWADAVLTGQEVEKESPKLVVNSTAVKTNEHDMEQLLPAQMHEQGAGQEGLLPSQAVEAQEPRPAGLQEQLPVVLTSACKSPHNSLEDTLTHISEPSESELQDDATRPMQVEPPGPAVKRRRLVKFGALKQQGSGVTC